MREIKFRVFDIDEEEGPSLGMSKTFNMYDYEIFFEKERKVNNYITISQVRNSPDIYFTMQYTEILDKNDNEIFESDIIKTNDGFIGEVSFYDGAFWLELPQCHQDIPLHLIEKNHMEIIGNIFENPEILENKGGQK